MEKIIEVQWLGQPIKITLRCLTYGEYKKILRKSIVNEGKEAYRDLDLYDELCILTSIKDAPFEKIIQNIHKLSIHDGKKLEKTVNEMNFPNES